MEERERGIEIERQSNGTLQSEYEMPPDNNRYSQSGSVQPENTRTPVNPPTPSIQQEAQAQVASIIIRATTEELSPDLTDRLLSHLANSPSLYPMELLACSVLSALFNTNPSLTRGLVSLFLASGSKSQRKDIITSLQFLPISLGSLEMLNDLVSKTALLNKDETSHLVHGVLSNGVRAAEDMGGVDKQAQARLVRLLCLFLQSVVRCDVVGLEDVYYIIQDLGVKFMYVKEARELWRVYCAN